MHLFVHHHPNHRHPSQEYHRYHGPKYTALRHQNNRELTLVIHLRYHCYRHPNLHHQERRHCHYQHHSIEGKDILDPSLLYPILLDTNHPHQGLNLDHRHPYPDNLIQ